MRKTHRKLTWMGSLAFTLGLAAAVAIGLLAPYTHGYTPLHIQLASAAFIGVAAGTFCYLAAARAARGILWFQCAALLAIVFLCSGPVDFQNDRLLTGLAFWEWVLCADCAAALWALACCLDRQPLF